MATEFDTARSNYENLRYCYTNGHQDWLIKAAKCIRFRNNEQWTPGDRQLLERARRPALTLNMIEPLLRAMRGTQRAMRNDVRFSPVEDADDAAAQTQDMLWLHIQNMNSLDFVESEIYERGLITGRAYYDVRVGFDDQLQGQVKITGLRSQDVILDPCVDGYDPETWPQVFISRWSNLLDIRNLFGKEKAEALKYVNVPEWYDYEDELMGNQLSHVPYYMGGWETDIDRDLIRALRLIDRQYYVLKNKEVFVDTQTGDTSEIPETWDRARISHVLQSTPGLSTMKRMVKTVRWTVSCENVVLHDDDSPYKWFTTVPFFPNFLDGNTMSPLETLLDPQEMFNKVSSQELHIINTTANSGWTYKTGNLVGMTREQLMQEGSMTGLALEVNDISQIQKIQPNPVPAGHDRISMKASQIMRDISGVSQQARGFAREDVAGEAILMNQAAADVNFAAYLANLHRSKQILAMRVLDCVQAYYTETRAIMINRGSTFQPDFATVGINQPTPEGTVVNDVTRGKYTTVLVPSPSRTTMTESEFEQLVMLREKLGVQIPDAMLIELSSVPNKTALIQQLKGDSNAQNAKQQQMEDQIQSLNMQLLQAKTQKESGAAQLNVARAHKATVEAQTDPDAAYAQVENNRIAADSQMQQAKLVLDQQKLGLQRRGQDHNTALALTKIDADNARHKQSLVADAASSAQAAAVEAAKPKEKPGASP